MNTCKTQVFVSYVIYFFMKVYLLTVFLISLSTFSQNKEIYFLNILDTTKTKRIEMNTLDSLSTYYKKNNKFNEYAKYAELFVNLAIKEKSYKKAAHMAVNVSFTINNRLGQRERALQLLNKAEKNILATKDTSLLAKIYLKKGAIFYNGKNFDVALNNYNLAKKLFSDKDSILLTDAIFFSGQVYLEKGKYLKALNNFMLASKYYKKLNDFEYYDNCLESIITIYSLLGFNRKSIKKRKEFIEEKKYSKNKNGLILNYYNLSKDYKKIDAKKKQLKYLLKADSIIKITNDVKTYLKINTNVALAKFYADVDIKEADKRIKKAEKILKPMDDNVFGYQYYKITKAYILLKQNNTQKAKKILYECLMQPDDSYEIEDQIELYRILSLVYQELKKPYREIFFFKLYVSKKDALEKQIRINSLNYFQSLFENELKEKKIKEQKASIALLKVKNANKKRMLFLSFLGFCLFVLIVVLISKKNALKRKKNQKIQFTQNLLSSQEEERKRIAKDLHDGLGQSLLLIKNEVFLLKDNNKLKKLIDNSINEVRMVARGLHPFQILNINNALNNLVSELDNSFKDIYLFKDFDNIENILTKKQELNLYRIIQECLSNILKHSKAKSARVSIVNKKYNIYLYIKDNGVGFNFSEKYQNTKSLGLKTIRERARILNATLQINSFINQGTSITIKIPKS